MNHWYFIVGAVILLISVILIVICMMQEQKPQNATAALSGASNDSFYDKNRGKTKEARLKKITFVFSVAFFVLILFVDILLPLLTKYSVPNTLWLLRNPQVIFLQFKRNAAIGFVLFEKRMGMFHIRPDFTDTTLGRNPFFRQEPLRERSPL